MKSRVPVGFPQKEQQNAGQSVQAPNANILSLEVAKILAITKIVLNLMEQNGQ
jgi:hypothetical protein